MQVVAQRHADPLVAIRKRLAFAGAAIAAPFVPCDETVPERDDGHLYARRTLLADVVLRFGQQRTAKPFGRRGSTVSIPRCHVAVSPAGSSKTHPASCAPSWSRINSRVLFPAPRPTASVAGSVLGPASNPTSLVQPAPSPRYAELTNATISPMSASVAGTVIMSAPLDEAAS